MSSSIHPWPTLPLGELAAEMCLGKMLDKQKNRGTLQPYLRNVNVRWFAFDLSDMKQMRFETDEQNRFDLQAGDLVVCEGGEPGRAAVWRGQTEGAKIQKALHRIRFDANEYDPSFAMYYIYYGTITNRFAKHYTGTTIKHLTGIAFSQVHFPIPSIGEQRRIVAKVEELFSDLDAAVATLERVQATLKRYRAAVLKAAVEGKLTEEWRRQHPNAEPATKLLDRILKERRRRWEEAQLAKFAAAKIEPPKNWQAKYQEPAQPDRSGLPGIPESWLVANLDQISTTITSGSRDWSRYYNRGSGTFIMAQNVRPGRLDFSSRQSVDPPLGDRDRVRSQIRNGDLLITIVGANTGDVCRVTNDFPEHYVCQSVALLRPVDAFSMPFLEFYLLSDDNGQRQFKRYIYGQGRPHLGFDELRITPVVLPPCDEQAEIVREVEDHLSVMDQLVGQIEDNLKRSTRLRQAILKRAFEGKLVPQDPTDEPADKLLERIRAASNGSTVMKPQKGRRRQEEAAG